MPPLLFIFQVLSFFLSPVLFDPSIELCFSLYIPHIPAVSKCSVLGSFLDFLLMHSGFCLFLFLFLPLSLFQSPFLLHSRMFYPNVLSSFPSVSLLPSGFLWSPIARQVLHRVAEPVLDDDAVHRGLGHPQLQPDGPL